jgi:hypothetical protein
MRHQVVHVYAAEPVGENVGQFRHHLENPVRIFADNDEFEVSMLSVYDQNFCAIATQVNLLILHGFARPEYATLLEVRKAKGLSTAFEIADDWFSLGAWLPEKQRQIGMQQRANLLNLSAQADALLFCTKGLESVFASVNQNTAVLDYFVPSPQALKPKSERFVFGWAGSTTHLDDLMSVVPAIEQFCLNHPEVVFSIMGNPTTFAPLFQNLAPEQFQILESGGYDRYLDFLSSLHVGLAPLVQNDFNRGRTDAKFVEYAVNGVVSVLSEVQVFLPHSNRAMLFTDHSSLLTCLEKLYHSPELRKQLSETAFTWVQQERSAEAIVRQHKHLYKQLIGQTAPTYVEFERGKVSVRETLTTAWNAYSNQNFQSTFALLDQLQIIAPDLQQALWLKVLTMKSLGQHQEIIKLLTGTQVSPMYLPLVAEIGYQAAKKVKPELAATFFQALPEIAKLHLIELEPVERFRAILNTHPYDYFALIAMIQHLEDTDPTAPELVELRQRSKFFNLAGV